MIPYPPKIPELSPIGLRHLAQDLHVRLQRTPGGLSVWWDIPRQEFYALARLGCLGQTLLARITDDLLPIYVGEFDQPISVRELLDALTAHAAGHLSLGGRAA